MKLISENELRNLLLESEVLRRLENGGVDNWGYYYEALTEEGDLEDWEEQHLDSIIAKYPDYKIKEFDNFNYD